MISVLVYPLLAAAAGGRAAGSGTQAATAGEVTDAP